jgi:hypothetical protein
MPRNHPRINQTSTTLIQSWRANCDLQILIYESNPDNFDVREISKVTDYVVAYTSKGSTTYKEEVEMNKRIILATDETTGDSAELKSLCKHLSNKASSSRLISKPEAVVMLGNLDLTICSDHIEMISLSNNAKLTMEGHTHHKGNVLSQYANRNPCYEGMSLHQFYPILRQQRKPSAKGICIPHYVGVKGMPVYPVSQGYARHVLLVYQPWRVYPNMKDWKYAFHQFINSAHCPISAKLTYNRVLQRHYDGTKMVEPISNNLTTAATEISEQDKEVLVLAGLGGLPEEIVHGLDFDLINRGKDFNWGKQPKVRS